MCQMSIFLVEWRGSLRTLFLPPVLPGSDSSGSVGRLGILGGTKILTAQALQSGVGRTSYRRFRIQEEIDHLGE